MLPLCYRDMQVPFTKLHNPPWPSQTLRMCLLCSNYGPSQSFPKHTSLTCSHMHIVNLTHCSQATWRQFFGGALKGCPKVHQYCLTVSYYYLPLCLYFLSEWHTFRLGIVGLFAYSAWHNGVVVCILTARHWFSSENMRLKLWGYAIDNPAESNKALKNRKEMLSKPQKVNFQSALIRLSAEQADRSMVTHSFLIYLFSLYRRTLELCKMYLPVLYE